MILPYSIVKGKYVLYNKNRIKIGELVGSAFLFNGDKTVFTGSDIKESMDALYIVSSILTNKKVKVRYYNDITHKISEREITPKNFLKHTINPEYKIKLSDDQDEKFIVTGLIVDDQFVINIHYTEVVW